METKQRRAPVKQSRQQTSKNRSASGSSSRRNATATKKPVRNHTPRRKTGQKRPSADVVYVQPAPFNRMRFVLCLLIVVAVVLAVVFGMSIFFKVNPEKIIVSGTNKYTPWQIWEASGIREGENLFSVNEARVSSKILDTLPYVNKVRVGIKLPDTVKIEIEELTVVYSVEASDGSWWLVRSDGVAIEKTNDADAQLHTVILGVKIVNPKQGETVAAFQPVQQEGEEVAISVIASEQLSAALTIAQHLETNGIIGEAKKINVTELEAIELWYDDRYQVKLGNTAKLDYKVEQMALAIKQWDEHDRGIMDVTFTIWPNSIGKTSFPPN